MAKKKEETRADEATKPEPEPVTEFTIKKGLNPYGFLHIPKRARGSLPFEQGAPLKAKIEEDALVIRRA